MNNLNPDWKLLYVSLSELCDNDFNMMLKVILRTEFLILDNRANVSGFMDLSGILCRLMSGTRIRARETTLSVLSR